MPQTERRFVTQLSHNEPVQQTFLACDKNLRPNRNGNFYLQLGLADRSGTIDARLWNASEKDYKGFENGDYVMVDGSTQLFQGTMQLIINNIRKARPDEVDESDFLTRQPEEIEGYAKRLQELLRSMNDASLRNLAECFLMDETFMAKFTRAPAGMKNHHAYLGGLVEHVTSVMELVKLVAPRYPALNQDKLLGAFLHDMSKIDELIYERELGYSDEGQMLGHMVLAVSLLDEKIREAEKLGGEPFPKTLAMELKHMIISHHGEYQYGSSKLPMTLEAVALNLLDNIDAKMASLGGLIADCPNSDSNWTQYFPNLDRKLWKGARS
jgi:3'-5' exoribonuclease